MDQFQHILDLFNKFILPILLFIWKDVRSMQVELHKVRERMVRVETKLNLKHSE